MYENHLPKYRNPVQLCDIYGLKVEIHLETSNVENRN